MSTDVPPGPDYPSGQPSQADLAHALQLAAKAALDGGQGSSGEHSSDSLLAKSTPFAEARQQAFPEQSPGGPRRLSLDSSIHRNDQALQKDWEGKHAGGARHAAHPNTGASSCWPSSVGLNASRSSSGAFGGHSYGTSTSNPGLSPTVRKSIEIVRPSLDRSQLEHTTYEDVGPATIIRDADGQEYLIQPIRESLDHGRRVSIDGGVTREAKGGARAASHRQSGPGADLSHAHFTSEFSQMSISRQSIDENRDFTATTSPSRPAGGNAAGVTAATAATAGPGSGGGGHVGQMYWDSIRHSAPVSIGVGIGGARRNSARSLAPSESRMGSQSSLDNMYDFLNQRSDAIAGYIRHNEHHLMDSEWEIDIHDIHFGPRIGRGAYGEVFKGVYRETEVAIKLFVDQDVSDKVLEAFRKEVDILKKLRHPNILHFMGYCTVPPHMCIVTEYEHNGSLFKLLHRTKIRLDNSQKLKIALDTAIGMHYLHTSKPPIVHGDLKSPNLLLGDNLNVKICDFGLSRFRMATKLSAGSKLGTPEWTAPEVLQSSRNSEAGDVYSYGVVLWELFTGQIPWEEISAMQVVLMVGFHKARLPIPTDSPKWAQELMESCFRAAEERPTFSDIISRLRCQSGDGI